MSTLLSLFLIVLSCLPCADGSNDGNISHSSIAAQHTNHDTEKHADLCSPFCSCNCCGAQVLNFIPSLLYYSEDIVVACIERPKIFYESHMASMFSGSIWQPPQIV